ncbi:MAG: hypothetical protein AB1510_02185 [Bacillota bacterium]
MAAVVLGFISGGILMLGGVALGALMSWRLMQRESPLPVPARLKLFECFAHTDESEARMEERNGHS